LYYFSAGNKLVFSSELKVILANKAYNKQIDPESLNTLLSFRYNPAPHTIYKNIWKLKAGHFLTYDFKGGIEEKKYWSQQQKIQHNISKEDAIEEYKSLLQQAVKRQLLSDVSVGLLLSGGLDSAVLGYLMSKHNTTPVKTFTVGFEGKGDFNETEYARETAELIGSEHHEILINRKIYLDTFYKSFYHVEEPIAESTIPALNCVSKLASEHVKVVLSGQGIDEPMSGYKRYYGEHVLSKYKHVLPLLPVNLLSKAFPRNHTLARGAHAVKYKNDLDRFVGIYTIFTNELKSEVYNDSLQKLKDASQHHLFEEALSIADTSNGSLSKLLYVDTRTMLPDNLLLFNDKITMANSIENRVPYLDVDLVNFIESLPVKFKLSGRTGKYLHREAVQAWIPKAIINRKKRGFATPVDQWFQEELSGTLSDLASSTDSFSRRYFKPAAIEKMLSDHRNKKHNYKHQLFMLLSLELWYTNFYKKF
jgi:asparagine synthase (glutamine-hydrolysing)